MDSPRPSSSPRPGGPRARGRPPGPIGKREMIVTHLRSRIVRGQHPPGARLPTCAVMAQSYDVNLKTMQAALSGLIRDGFIITRGRRGTFVAERPPHQFRYGLVLRDSLQQLGPTSTPRLARFLYEHCAQLRQSRQVDLRIYAGVAGHAADPATSDLVADVQGQRLAGLIFDTPLLAKSAFFSSLLTRTAIPSVALTSYSPEQVALLGKVILPRGPMIDVALQTLARMGRRRLAVLAAADFTDNPPELALLRASAQAHGLDLPRGGIVASIPRAELYTRCAVHALLDGRQTPDALFIADDALVGAATEAILESGLRVPEDIAVVAHANFPYATPTSLPFRRVGFDLRDAINQCFALIDAHRRKGSAVSPVALTAILDDQVPPEVPVYLPPSNDSPSQGRSP